MLHQSDNNALGYECSIMEVFGNEFSSFLDQKVDVGKDLVVKRATHARTKPIIRSSLPCFASSAHFKKLIPNRSKQT